MEGEAEADQVNAFLKGLGNVPFDHQLQMWGALRKLEGIKKLSEGTSQMYFTPNDVNLSIEGITGSTKGGSRR